MSTDTLSLILDRLNDIDAKLDRLLADQDQMKHDTNKMSTHIDFIHRVYNQLSFPFSYLFKSVDNRSARSAVTGPVLPRD
jgi:hypothetical protein